MDMIKDKMVVAIKVGGKVLRETKDLVTLPFGVEFSVLVKNLNSRRSKFKLHIDGTDVLGGESIVVNANSEVEMKRFIRNGNMNEGNAFKFIERTESIEDGPRGIKIDDGIVRVEFWFEKEVQAITHVYHHHYDTNYYRNPYSPNLNIWPRQTVWPYVEPSTNSILRGATASSVSVPAAPAPVPASLSTGITVPGSKMAQAFTTVYGFDSETTSNVIVLRLAGKIGQVQVKEPVIARAKQKCTTCSHVNKSSAKFCSKCGTSLVIV